jgi:hypothetical protein
VDYKNISPANVGVHIKCCMYSIINCRDLRLNYLKKISNAGVQCSLVYNKLSWFVTSLSHTLKGHKRRFLTKLPLKKDLSLFYNKLSHFLNSEYTRIIPLKGIRGVGTNL